MKAITVTTAIKNANVDLFKNFTVGSIRTFGSIPTSFAGVSKNYQRTDMYQTLSNAIHEADGFFDVVTPAYDEATQKLGAIFFNVTEFTYPIVAKTQQEQDDYQQDLDDNDLASQTNQQYKSDGQIGFDRAYALITRRFLDATITANQASGLAQGLYPSLEPLYKGLWQLVKQNLAAETPPANADLLAIFNKIKDGVDDYVTNNY